MKTRQREKVVRVLRILAVAIGTAAIGFTCYRIYATAQMLRTLRLSSVWQQAFTWQRGVLQLLSMPDAFLHLRVIDYAQLGVHAGAVAVAILLAPLLGRARLGWGVLSFLFPFVGPTVLGLRGSARTVPSRHSGVGRLTELHVVALLVAVGVAAATAHQAYVLIRVSPARAQVGTLLGQTVFMWARVDTGVGRYLILFPLGIAGTAYLQLRFLNLHVPAVVVSIMLAKALNRSRLDYAILSAVLPYVAPLALVFQSRKATAEPGLVQRFFDALFSSTGQGGWVNQRKQCGKCGKQVSLSARAGQRCPHCGARWSAERTLRR